MRQIVLAIAFSRDYVYYFIQTVFPPLERVQKLHVQQCTGLFNLPLIFLSFKYVQLNQKMNDIHEVHIHISLKTIFKVAFLFRYIVPQQIIRLGSIGNIASVDL